MKRNQIKFSKGNIPIDTKILNKYPNVQEIFKKEADNFDIKVKIVGNITELENINITKLKSKEIKKLAYNIFTVYNSKAFFTNNGNKIIVSKSGINEGIEKNI